jgi:hypothetical protein
MAPKAIAPLFTRRTAITLSGIAITFESHRDHLAICSIGFSPLGASGDRRAKLFAAARAA